MITDEERDQAWHDYMQVCEFIKIERTRSLTPSERGKMGYYNWRFGKHIEKINEEKEYKKLKEIMRQI